jgi:hypothetical protein
MTMSCRDIDAGRRNIHINPLGERDRIGYGARTRG